MYLLSVCNTPFSKLCNLVNAIAGRSATLLKKRLWHRCFSVNFAKFLRTPFLQNTSGGYFCIVLAMQSKSSGDNAKLLEEISKLNSKFDFMPSDLVVIKSVNSELSSRLVNMEC